MLLYILVNFRNNSTKSAGTVFNCSMKTSLYNITLIIVGVVITCIGLFRTYPIRFDTKFIWSNGPMILGLLLTVVLVMKVGGAKSFNSGMDATVGVAASFMPMLILLIPLIGLSVPLAHHYGPKIGEMLGSRFGYLAAFFTGLAAPSGNAFASVIAKLWTEKVELRPLLLYFLSVVPLTSVSIFYIRKLGLGDDVATAMYKCNLAIAVILMPGFWLMGRFLWK